MKKFVVLLLVLTMLCGAALSASADDKIKIGISIWSSTDTLGSEVKRLIAEKRLKAIEVADVGGGSVRTLEVNGLFVAVGRIPENQNFAGVVPLDEAGYIRAGEDCLTPTPGIFAAGDNRTKRLRQLVTATADGAMAATEAVHYLSETENNN